MSLLIDITKSVRGKDISKVPANYAQHRLEICESCPLNGASVKGVCGKLEGTKLVSGCGCVLSDKVKYAKEKCPEGKWFEYE